MTGGEIVAVGKAVEAAGKKVLAEDEKTKDALLRVGEDTPEFRAAARSSAARTAVKERIKLLFYWPFARMLGVSQDYFEDTFPQEMNAKIADIPEENLIAPPASVAVPALQGLSYTFEEPNLKDMFLGLLATASDDRRAGQAHPAFAEIIKQLSPDEAKLLNVVLGADRQLPIARIVDKPVDIINSPANNFVILVRHLLPVARGDGNIAEESRVSMWVDNWVRLGLVEATYNEYTSGENMYDWVRNRPEYVSLDENTDIPQVDFQKGVLRSTSFGRQFCSAVC